MKKIFLSLQVFIAFGVSAQMPIVKNTDSLKTTVDQLGLTVNSNYLDVSPILSTNGKMLYFSSNRPMTDKDKLKNVEGAQNVFVSNYSIETGAWGMAEAIEAPLNGGSKTNQIVSLSKDGNRMLLAREKKPGNMDLYEAVKVNGVWTEAKPLGDLINSESNETSACFSPDGRVMYFISDRSGGKGKKDIWQATRYENGNWSAPKNLGGLINSTNDEEGIFAHPDGKTLYFSSKGHNSTGGYDIYKSIYVNDQWSEPINLGEPVNSYKDDLFYMLSLDGKKAFYASDRNGDIDIFEVQYQYKKEGTPAEPTSYMLLGQITDLNSDVPVGAKIEVYDADKKQLIATHESNDESGKFSFNLLAGKNYALSITAPFYIFYSDFIAASDSVRYGQMEKDFKVQKLERGAKIILRNLYFDEGKASIKPESANELNRLFQLLAKNSKLVIEISGHSDSQGSAPQNQGLWESRAKAVYDYYVSEGIPRERLQVKGYGKTQPIVTDEQIAQLKTKKEKDAAHAKNRRIEVKVITY